LGGTIDACRPSARGKKDVKDSLLRLCIGGRQEFGSLYCREKKSISISCESSAREKGRIISLVVKGGKGGSWSGKGKKMVTTEASGEANTLYREKTKPARVATREREGEGCYVNST